MPFLFLFLDVSQMYETRVSDEFVILGNDALVKCGVPSFASDYLKVISWVTNENYEILELTNGKFTMISDAPKRHFQKFRLKLFEFSRAFINSGICKF